MLTIQCDIYMNTVNFLIYHTIRKDSRKADLIYLVSLQKKKIGLVLGGGGGVLPNLGVIGRFHSDDTLFRFSIRLGPSYFIPHHDLIDPLFPQKKVSLSPSHLP